MPLTPEALGELFARADGEAIARAVAPLRLDEQPLAPRIPGDREGGQAARLSLLQGQGHRLTALADPACLHPPQLVAGNIENYLGVTRVPVGLVGPLRIRGTEAHGDFYVPMATTEGALVASCNRGAKVLGLAGGVSAVCVAERVARAPGFEFRDLGDAARFLAFALGWQAELKAAAEATTRHGVLAAVRAAWDGNTVVLLLEFTCGEAAGQNLVTVAADAACRALLAAAPVQPEAWAIDSNLSGDKKATHVVLGGVRGKRVTAEARVPAPLVESELRTSVAAIVRFWSLFTAFGVQSGQIGMQGHYANALAAIFLACGQDVACVAESAIGLTRMEETRTGDLRVVVNLPSITVGTVGGGTALPAQRECLELLGCTGPGSARKLAEICAATALAGELSGAAALAAGHFTAAHRTLGRKAT